MKYAKITKEDIDFLDELLQAEQAVPLYLEFADIRLKLLEFGMHIQEHPELTDYTKADCINKIMQMRKELNYIIDAIDENEEG